MSESPVDSRRVALEWYAVGSADNAASIAGMLLTTECVLCDIKEPEPAAPATPAWAAWAVCIDPAEIIVTEKGRPKLSALSYKRGLLHTN